VESCTRQSGRSVNLRIHSLSHSTLRHIAHLTEPRYRCSLPVDPEGPSQLLTSDRLDSRTQRCVCSEVRASQRPVHSCNYCTDMGALCPPRVLYILHRSCWIQQSPLHLAVLRPGSYVSGLWEVASRCTDTAHSADVTFLWVLITVCQQSHRHLST
jgi:hypothetical protein